MKCPRYSYTLQPLVMSASDAHRHGWVEYLPDATAIVRSPSFEQRGLPSELKVPPGRQFPVIRATFDDLNKALSRLANSPSVDGGESLRNLYEDELAQYEAAVEEAQKREAMEPDYGSYVLDHHAECLYLIAPERWHRLALVTSNSKLSTDPAGQLSWQQIRAKLEGAVIGFAGLSVGGNLLEGWLREARPKQVKIADPDWLELTNFNRCERASLRHFVASRAARFEPRNPYEVQRIAKAEYIAYEHNLVDPYLEFFVYQEPLSAKNARQFLLGNGADEPPIDILVEEIDDLDMKVELRELAREHRIDVLMVTDFGHRTQLLWNPFRDSANATLGAGGNDERLREALARTRDGERGRLFGFVDELCRFSFDGDPFENYVKGQGEQPTASLPQSGSTTLLAGGLGGKELVFRTLGHRRAEKTHAIVFDYLQQTVNHQ